MQTSILLTLSLVAVGCRSLPASGLVTVNDTKLYCHVIGSGEPIVIVHGGLDHTYFLPQFEELARTHRLIFFDQRASGRSSARVDPKSVRITQFVADLDAVREHFGLDRFHLLGHSWGGLLALYYAQAHPDRLRTLILVDSTPASQELAALTSPRLTDEDLEEIRALRTSGPFQRKEESAYEQLFRILFRASFFDRDRIDELTLSLQPGFAARAALLGGLQEGMENYDLHDGLGVIDCPTLVIHGAADDNPREGAERIARAIPAAKLVVIEECGHFPFVEQPTRFFDLLGRFLSSHCKPPETSHRPPVRRSGEFSGDDHARGGGWPHGLSRGVGDRRDDHLGE